MEIDNPHIYPSDDIPQFLLPQVIEIYVSAFPSLTHAAGERIFYFPF